MEEDQTGGERELLKMSAKNIQRVYHKKSLPCWICSKSLQQLTYNKSLLSNENKEHAGQYIGFIFDGLVGFKHTAHLTCIEQERDEQV